MKFVARVLLFPVVLLSAFLVLMLNWTLNLSAFVLRITGAPNYRPRFKACTWQVSLTGAALCCLIMFYIDWV